MDHPVTFLSPKLISLAAAICPKAFASEREGEPQPDEDDRQEGCCETDVGATEIDRKAVEPDKHGNDPIADQEPHRRTIPDQPASITLPRVS